MRTLSLKNIFRLTFLILALTAWGCSTKKNTPVSRTYHNVTARYNYFFNAKQSYSNAIKRAEKDFDYNYTFPLPVLLVGQQKVISAVGGDMDRAITKSTDLINLHSITVKPERKRGKQTSKDKIFYNQSEYVRWVRDAWLLIGKARVWKGSYDEARMTFEYVLVQFPETPLWYESHVWLARIEMLNGDFLSAEDRLRSLSANRKYPKDKYFSHLLQSTWASYYYKQNQYEPAIKHLKLALDNAPDKALKQRYTYLLGQLYQKQKQFAESNKYFKKVVKLNPNYEMSFNAKVNLASNFQGGKGSQDLIKTLNKMTRDEKNTEFLDQIYYALGNIEQSKGDMDKAIGYYQLSAQKSISNNHQKGLSYLILADHFFAKPNYTVSQAYYDSAYNALDEDYPSYRDLEIKTQNLNKLVENLNIVSHQDSLQRIAAMGSKERDALIAELIKRVRDEEERLKSEEQEGRDRFSHFQRTQQRGGMNQDQGGSWYFYNQSSLSQGLAEFSMRWGRRKLEDNWRRSNKREVLDPNAEMAQLQDTTGMPLKILDNKSREFYLQDLPTTDSLMAISHKLIQEAMLKVGEVYEKDLKDYPEAIKAYEELGIRYPKGEYTLQGYYNLYQISRFLQNSSDEEKYKQIIVSRFPNSTYALMLSNPSYVQNIEKEEKEREAYYQNTFALFRKGDFAQASKLATEGIEKYKGTDVESKLKFIKAQCMGSRGDISGYKIALTEIVDKYPNTELAASATDIIRFIEQRELQLATVQQTPDDYSQVIEREELLSDSFVKPDGEHLFLAIVPKGSPVNQLRFNLVSFNVDNFIDMNLSVSIKELTEFVDLIVIEKFKNKDVAMEYYNAIVKEEGIMSTVKPENYSHVVISRNNYKQFLEDKAIADYLSFFRANYLK
ncbi:MAG: tetratricopeptide repeat protein [Bacteroidales bacterium]|nr:tetratricopeptide repeat protein [Bacteroidales bacterium]